MINPYKANYKVTQPFGENGHRGIDLSAAFGVGDTTIVAVQSGRCIKAGWDNGGYGFCVVIVDTQNRYWIYGHLSKVLINADTNVNIGDTIGIEGNSGNSFGSHLHLEARQNGWDRGNVSLNVASILGIPNVRGIINNTSNIPAPIQPTVQVPTQNVASSPSTSFTFNYNVREDVKELQNILNSKGFSLVVDGKFGNQTLTALKKYTIEINDKGTITKWVQNRLNACGFNAGFADGIAEAPTMEAIQRLQEKYNLGSAKKNGYTYLGGDDWYYLVER